MGKNTKKVPLMRLCPKCSSSLLPFVMVFFIAGVSAYVTGLTLAYSQWGLVQLIAGSVAAFLAVAATLAHYVISCMKRHCRHGSQPGHRQGTIH